MQRAAIFDDAYAPDGCLAAHAMVEQNDAVGNIFLQPLTRQRLVATLAGDDRGYAAFFQPVEQAAQFGAQDERIGQAGKNRFNRIQHNALGADAVNRIRETDEQTIQIKLPAFFNFTAFDTHVVYAQLVLLDKLIQVVTERRNILTQLCRGFLERHEYARLVVLHRTAHQKLHAQ